jgi:tetratricopeptide (TPR) repeat protein
VVHRWSRERLNRDERKRKARKAVILTGRLLVVSSDGPTPDSQAVEKKLMPHVQLCFKHICHSGYLDDIQTGSVRDVLDMIRRMAYALQINNQSIKIIFDMTKRLARVLRNNYQLESSVSLYQWILERQYKILGKKHVDTLEVVHDMASAYERQCKHDDALECYRRALAGFEKALGRDHQYTLTTVNNMALVFMNQGKYDDALEWFQRALVGREKALGKDHPSTLGTVINMANVFLNQGMYDDALEWFRRTLAGREALDKDCLDTLTAVENIAWLQGEVN